MPEEQVESLNLDLLLNAYKEEGKTKDTSMEPLIVFSDEEEEEPVCQEQVESITDITSDWDQDSLPIPMNPIDESKESVPVQNVEKEEEEDVKEAKGAILPLMMVVSTFYCFSCIYVYLMFKALTGQAEAFADMQTKIQDQVTKMKKEASKQKKRKQSHPAHFWDEVVENPDSGKKTRTYSFRWITTINKYPD